MFTVSTYLHSALEQPAWEKFNSYRSWDSKAEEQRQGLLHKPSAHQTFLSPLMVFKPSKKTSLSHQQLICPQTHFHSKLHTQDAQLLFSMQVGI